MYFYKKQVKYMGAASWSKSKSHTYTLAFSSLSYGLIFGIYMFVYSGFVPIALVTVVIIAFYALITYLLFAVPVQLWLRKKPKSLVWFIFSFIPQSLF